MEYKCKNCACRVWNDVTQEYECKYAWIPGREGCKEDFEKLEETK